MDEETLKDFEELFDFDASKKQIILNKIITDDIITGNKIDISDDVYKDTGIDKWISQLPVLEGSQILIEKLIRHPINDKALLVKRQNTMITYDIDIEILKEYENDILWIYKIAEEINNNASIEILFPSTFIINYINYIEQVLDLYHLYKIYFIPATSILYPLSTFIAPYVYLTNYMKMDISFASYLEIFYNILQLLFRTTGNFRADITKFVSIFMYIGVYLYNMYQTYEIALFLHNTKHKLHAKMQGLVHFVRHSQNIMKNLPTNLIAPFFNIKETYQRISINNSMTDIYRIWKDDGLKGDLSSLLKTIYAVDAIDTINKLLLSGTGEWSRVAYGDRTLFWDAKNPVLKGDGQVANPVNLDKNIIVTGPNAGGKTTYVKTILANVILGHTVGITYSVRSQMILYDTINSFMRVTDILGTRSYFEAEAEYCLNMIKKAVEISATQKRGLFLMDEPMHSTPPTEGMATAYAVIEYLSKLEGITLIITTHFHKLVKLEELYPEKFINLSVDAIADGKKYIFPYKIKRGYSYLCIAIELLDIKEFPSVIIENAIKMKNKICSDFNK